ncbi:MAG: serine/threonine-protein kinase, partial [Fuerstiella sp.]
MTDSNALGHEDEAPTDELLADLERLAETRNSSRRTGSQDAPSISDSAASSEHQRLYMFVDELASPIRAALVADEAPPILPEYGELEEVGRGGMGIVYRSTHQKMQRVDAIKVIRPDRLTGVSFDAVKQMQNRFEREVRLAAYVAHEHIVPVYQVGEIDGCPWFSMQFVIGTTLNELSKPDVSNTSQVPSPLEVLKSEVPVPERMAGYIEKIARAVDAVHRHGILHGDIKPHNILIETETDRPLLSDFGLAEFDACDASMTSTGVAGTLAYMAPELAQAAKRNASPDEIAANRSVSSDVYSLGATLWAALTGRSPREADGFPSTLPVELLRICQKSMAEDPSSRHASAKEFA